MRTRIAMFVLCLVGVILLAGSAIAADDSSATQTQGRSEVAIDDSLPVLAASVPTSGGTVFVPVYVATDSGKDSGKFTGYVYGGGQDVDEDDNSSKFEEYSSHPEGFVLPGFLFQYDTGDYYWYLKGKDVGQWDHRIDVGAGSPGVWALDLYWDRIPHNLSYDSLLPYDQVSGNEFRVASADQAALAALIGAANYTGAEAYINGLASNFNLEQREDFYGLNFSYRPVPEWDVNFGYELQDQNGYKAFASNIPNFVINEVPLPIDYTTQRYDVGAEWTGKKGFLGGRIEYQDFDNGYDRLIWDQPFVVEAAGNSYQGQASLAPDNDAIDFTVNGGINWGKSHRFTALLAYGDWNQDQDFLPYTINPSIATDELFARSLDGEIQRTLADLRYTGRFTDVIGLDAWFRHYRQDNNTPDYIVPEHVTNDNSFSDEDRGTAPVDYYQQNIGFDLGFDFTKTFSMSVGYELVNMKRDYREVDSQDTDVASLKFDYRPNKKFALKAGLEWGWRNYDDYDYVSVIENSYPEMTEEEAEDHLASEQRKYDEAQRDTFDGNLMMVFNPVEEFSFTIGFDYGDNEYDTYFGLLDEETVAYGIDFAWNPIERFGLFGNWAYETYEWNERQIYRNLVAGHFTDDPLDEWSTHNEDSAMTYGLGFKADLVKDRFTWDASYWRSDAEGELDNDYVVGGNPSGDATLDFPTVEQDWQRIETYFRIYGPKGWEFVAGYEYEKWDSENFKSDVMEVYLWPYDDNSNTTRSNFLGARVPGYSADIISFLVGYKW